MPLKIKSPRIAKKIIILPLVLLLTVVISLSLLGIFTPHITEIPEGFQGQHINLQDKNIRYFQKGSGKDILFIHSAPGSLEDWEPIFFILAQRYRVTTYDRPGHGFSSTENYKNTLSENATIAYELIEKLNLKDVTIVAHAYGSAVALALAIHNPVNVKSFVLVNAPTHTWPNKTWDQSLLATPIIGHGLATLLNKTAAPILIREKILKDFSTDMQSLPDNFIAERTKLWNQPKNLYHTAKEISHFQKETQKISETYNAITKPIYFLYGTEDLITKNVSKNTKNIFTTAKVFNIKEAGHYLQYVESRKLMAAIQRALKPTE